MSGLAYAREGGNKVNEWSDVRTDGTLCVCRTPRTHSRIRDSSDSNKTQLYYPCTTTSTTYVLSETSFSRNVAVLIHGVDFLRDYFKELFAKFFGATTISPLNTLIFIFLGV